LKLHDTRVISYLNIAKIPVDSHPGQSPSNFSRVRRT